MNMIEKIKNLFNLYLSFAKIGTFTIGGGLAMMPMMQAELIEKRKWITDEELIDYYAVGQSTPGIVAVNVATFVGYKQMGIIGGIFATLGMVTPSLVIIMILAGLINSINDYPVVKKALKGINVAVAALLTSTIINFMKKTIKKFTNAIFMMISFLLVFVFKIPSFWIILFALLIGVVLTYKEKKKAAVSGDDAKKSEGESK
jgi:chromate transporter